MASIGLWISSVGDIKDRNVSLLIIFSFNFVVF